MSGFFNDNDVVLFQGDSITDCNRERENPASLGNGYPAIIKAIYGTLFYRNTVTFINKGVSGDRVRNLLERYQEDIYYLQPTFISILIGINDVWRRYDNNDPCAVERFANEYTELLYRLRNNFPSIKIMLIEPFLIPTMPERTVMHMDLDPKREFIKEIAKEYADYYLPLHGIFMRKIINEFTASDIAPDCVHPSSTGHTIIAAEYLKLLNIL